MIPPVEPFWALERQRTHLIVGFAARTGVPAARLFDQHDVRYKISDQAPLGDLLPRLQGLRVAPHDVFSGPQTPEQLEGIDCVLLSPGVPRSIPLIREATRRQIPVLSDIDFLYPTFAAKRIVGISGTDGKTTTTTLLGELLAHGGRVVVAGNIGVSVLAVANEIQTCDWLVLELSSFMLEQVTRFRADYAVILNIAEDHIDRYPSRERYAETKLGMLRHARSTDVYLQNLDDEFLAARRPVGVRVITFSQREAADVRFENGVYRVGGSTYPDADCALRGLQNIPNILAALGIASDAGIAPEAIADTLRNFRGVPHRMQHVGCFRGVDVYEDSKAANVHAVVAALQNFPSNVVLILGGRDKGLDFTALQPHAHRVRQLVCYGESGELIRECLGFDGALYAYQFEDAVRLAIAHCRRGDVLLLSPGCTSWDQFPSYEVRGDAFQRLVPKLFG